MVSTEVVRDGRTEIGGIPVSYTKHGALTQHSQQALHAAEVQMGQREAGGLRPKSPLYERDETDDQLYGWEKKFADADDDIPEGDRDKALMEVVYRRSAALGEAVEAFATRKMRARDREALEHLAGHLQAAAAYLADYAANLTHDMDVQVEEEEGRQTGQSAGVECARSYMRPKYGVMPVWDTEMVRHEAQERAAKQVTRQNLLGPEAEAFTQTYVRDFTEGYREASEGEGQLLRLHTGPMDETEREVLRALEKHGLRYPTAGRMPEVEQ
jgi:hypothetical protein